jgi:hypothetical protein
MTHFDDIFKSAGISPPLSAPTLGLLEEVWSTLVGEELATKLRPVGWSDGTLTIAVVDQAWLEALRPRTHALRARMQRVFPWRIANVRWVVAEPDDLFLSSRRKAETDSETIGQQGALGSVALEELPEDVRHALVQFDPATRQRLLRIGAHVRLTTGSKGKEPPQP